MVDVIAALDGRLLSNASSADTPLQISSKNCPSAKFMNDMMHKNPDKKPLS